MKKSMKSAVLPGVQAHLSEIAHEIKAHRLALGMTISVLAVRSGSSPGTVKRIERGDPSVSIGHWAACWDVLGMLPRLTAAAKVVNAPGVQALQGTQLRVRGLRKDRGGHDF